ncbi:3-oxoacyl-(acyl-carrier-protein) synthase 3 [Candidatus Desulfarcum epimagneticum]|uniref:Beta-ketoacyl-[acyl-carrier-protein] synthase III n=1 Tax=uncultured Desulfobacteraceae bacterium TaxID=218296 RepID=A0A484HIC0_9BACT|nr:3-oxoacyl-(acyl-carrier-protein) synthase 3 [uncultured Desulfobacteraceae bacterium]
MRAIVTGMGYFTPKTRLSNHDLERMVDTSDEWITARTGIKERRILEKGKGTSYMAVRAARSLLAGRNIPADEIDMIIVATVTPDMPVPATAAFVQREIKASNCGGFDLNGGCAGFVCAFSIASQFIETGKYKKVMVIGADKMSGIIDYEDRNTCVIFGDGAGAVLLEPSEEEDEGVRDFILRLDGSGADMLRVDAGGSLHPATRETVEKKMHYVFQDGKAVFKHAVKGMADVSGRILDENDLSPDDMGLLVPHQANIRIIDAVSKKLDLPSEKVAVNLEKYGNTTAATIPIALAEAYEEGKIEKGDWVVISAFGAGFTWGSALFKWAMDKP